MTRVNLGPAQCVDIKGAIGLILGETWREERVSWGGCEGGEGSASVAGDADGFEVSHFGCGVCSGAGDGSFKESDPVGRQGGLAFVETAIWLKTNRAEVRCVATGQNSNGNIGSLWQGGDGVWE